MNCVFNTIKTLYEMQKTLDARIIREKGLEGQDLLPNTVLALQVEIGELANEWRGFKHWSNDREPRRKRMLEEYVDCLHFFLSIARQLGVPAEKLKNTDSPVIEKGIVNAFSGLMVSVGMIRVYEPAFNHAWNEFISLGKRLGFSWDEVSAAYVAKNRVNHERQENGY